MNKKHLRALNSLEKWLKEHNAVTDEVRSALLVLQKEVKSVPESADQDEDLPKPNEIADEPMTIALYSDGGCRGNPGPGAFAYVVQNHAGEVLAEGVEFAGLTTNNKMELSGPLKGLEDLLEILPVQGKAPLLSKVKVVTDSKYVVDGMKSWIHGWKSRGWKKADNKPPENLELWQALDEVSTKFMQIEWTWVKGHAGHPQNEYCDRKANELMDKHQS